MQLHRAVEWRKNLPSSASARHHLATMLNLAGFLGRIQITRCVQMKSSRQSCCVPQVCKDNETSGLVDAL